MKHSTSPMGTCIHAACAVSVRTDREVNRLNVVEARAGPFRFLPQFASRIGGGDIIMRAGRLAGTWDRGQGHAWRGAGF